MGARAVIAPLWPVDDEQAHEGALELYRRGLEPDAPPLAELLKQLRARAYEETNPDTYAAYCFYEIRSPGSNAARSEAPQKYERARLWRALSKHRNDPDCR